MRPRHIRAVPSSSTNIPVDTTLSNPLPTTRSFGMIFGLSEPSTFSASSRSGIPSMRGIEKPQMSASRTPTVLPDAASAAARFTVTDDLPTPPLPLAMARIRVLLGIAVGAAFSRAFHRARVMTAERSSAVISPQSILTLVTHGCTSRRDRMSFWIWARRGQPRMVSLTPMVTIPSDMVMSPAIPRSTMLSPNSGSITARRRLRTSSTVGAGTARWLTKRKCTATSLLLLVVPSMKLNRFRLRRFHHDHTD